MKCEFLPIFKLYLLLFTKTVDASDNLKYYETQTIFPRGHVNVPAVEFVHSTESLEIKAGKKSINPSKLRQITNVSRATQLGWKIAGVRLR